MRTHWWLWLAVGAFLASAATHSLCEARSDAQLPRGVKAVWDLRKAYRETTRTRERVCINGLWRWQPADTKTDRVPAGGWGYLKVPGPWPDYRVRQWMAKESQRVYRHPSWEDKDLTTIDMAWYQRALTVPRKWAGRRITLSAEYVSSYAGVYVDGEQVGEIYFPGGELDITAACRPGAKQALSLFTAAMPLHKRIEDYVTEPPDKRHSGVGSFRGMCGDVFLSSTPRDARIEDVKVSTSVRKWQIEVDAALAGLTEGQSYALRGQLLDGAQEVKQIAGEPFTAGDLAKGRIAFGSPWQPDKLWDIHTPENQYELALSLVDGSGDVVDESHPVRFGFREFWLDGRDFRLNGTRIFCAAITPDNAQVSPAVADYEGARESFRRLKKIGINTLYTHNHKCRPGSHLGFAEILRAADDVGMLVSFSLPNFTDYEWKWHLDDHPEETNGYPRDAEFYVRQAQNHPSVVMYSTSHNVLAYSQDQNPDLIDGVYSPWPDPEGEPGDRADKNARSATRVEAVVHGFDTTRPIYHHSSGNCNQMYTLNCYLDFVPIQERSDWFGHWSQEGVKPLFLVEYGVPIIENWLNYREGYVIFGSKMLHELLTPEWGSQYRGDIAYQLEEEEKANLRFEAERWRDQQMWHKSEFPFFHGDLQNANVRDVQAMFMAANWPHFRTWGVTAVSSWQHTYLWKLRPGADTSIRECKVDWERLQRPGYSPDFIDPYVRRDLAYRESDWIPNKSGEAFLRFNKPVLAYIAGKPARFTSNDHNFHPGETVEKQIIVINNSRRSVTCDCSWELALPKTAQGAQRIALETGEQARLPIRVALPETLEPGRYELRMTAKFSDGGDTQQDSFTIDVMQSARKPRVEGKVALLDPKGETAQLLTELDVKFDEVAADADLSGFDMFIIGKKALTAFGAGPDIGRVRDGLKAVVFEQTKETLERRLGFRVQEYCLRRVFPRVTDHPVLQGIGTQNLHDWRGEGTTVAPRLQQPFINPRVSAHGTWAGLRMKRAWRCGCYGSVASLLMEKPACGDFLPLCDGGFGLEYSPLMEYRDGEGMILFCQMDVTGRTEDDPASTRLVSNILEHVSSWKATPRRRALYVGDPAGRAHLESTGLSLAGYSGGALAADQVLIVGPGGGHELAAHSAAVHTWLAAGGNLLAIGLDDDQANAFLPFKVAMATAEHISAYFEPARPGSLLAGVGPADVHIRDPRELPLVSRGATPVGNGVLATATNANVVFCQLAPWQFDYLAHNGMAWHLDHTAHNVKPTFRHTSFLVTRLLANMGAAASTPMLARLGKPAVDGESLQDLAEAVWLESGDNEHVLSTRWKGLPLTRGSRQEPPAGWETRQFDDSDWRPIRIPGMWDEQYEDILAARAWFFYHRLKFDAPAEMLGDDVTLVLGPVHDGDWTYLNGTLIGSMASPDVPMGKTRTTVRRYEIPTGLLRPGENVLAFKAETWGTRGGMKPAGDPRQKKRLENVGAYLPLDSVRYAHGLYLDVPRPYDDPYRYLRW